MDENEETLIKKIDELINDEDKIITITWLSSTLAIPIAKTKEIMQKYVEITQINDNQIHVLYVIMGKLINGKGFGIFISKENELDNKRKLFEKVASEQIYSVQKHEDFDLTALTYIEAINKINEESNLLGFVVGKNCFKLKNKSKTPIATETLDTKKEPEISSKENRTNISNKKHEVVEKKNKNDGNIMGLFANAAKATMGKKTNIDTGNKIALDKENKNLSNVATDSSSENKKEGVDKKNVEINKSKEEITKKNESNKKKRQRKADIEQPVKRRKRIIETHDSDSDDMFESDEIVEDIIENSDDDEPKLKPEVQLSKMNKIKKCVTNTYNAEDGYIVTKRELMEMSDSDEDMKIEKPVAPSKLTPQENVKIKDVSLKPTVKQNTKKSKKLVPINQASITSFFKKK